MYDLFFHKYLVLFFIIKLLINFTKRRLLCLGLKYTRPTAWYKLWTLKKLYRITTYVRKKGFITFENVRLFLDDYADTITKEEKAGVLVCSEKELGPGDLIILDSFWKDWRINIPQKFAGKFKQDCDKKLEHLCLRVEIN